MNEKLINEKTRQIYHEQHKRVAENQIAMDRFMSMIEPDYFGVDKNFFSNKKLLDAGCGDTAKLSIKFTILGAKVTGVDLGEDFIPIARDSAKKQGLAEDSIKFQSANVISLPFKDEEFDFVCCHGVLLHLANYEQIESAFSELSRVTKKGGHLYTVFGVDGGLLEDHIIPAAREYYSVNKEFKTLIDNISPSNFEEIFENIKKTSEDYGIAFDIDEIILRKMFDLDFCVMLQNLLQAPVRLKVSESDILGYYKNNKFQHPKRLKRFVKRQNIRKYTAPLHYLTEFPISKIIYGSGNLEFIAQK